MARTFYNPYERDPVNVSSNSTDQGKVITSFDIDLSDIKAATTTRSFNVRGYDGAIFSLEVKNEDGHYYNFTTKAFQSGIAKLDNKTIKNGSYIGAITFPTITDDDQYDIYLSAEANTVHAGYNEVRFDDGTLDINSSTGSNSFLLQKVIYQYTDLTLILGGYSPNGTVAGTMGTDTITVARHGSKTKTAFSFTTTAGATAAYRILKQPVADDILSFLQPVVGSAPIDLPGENTYPTARAAFTGDDVNGAVTSGAVVRVDNTDLSAVIAVGDKITTTVMTDTVNGAVTSGVNVIMDSAVATKMAVGDRVTATSPAALAASLEAKVITVATINVGSDANTFALSEAVVISDGTTLSFSSKINRSLTTVTVVETSGTATDFTMSQDIQFRDNAPLTFTPRMNYSWPIDNYANVLKEDMIVVPDTNVTADTSIGVYEDSTTIFPDTEKEEKIIKNQVPALSTLAQKPTIVNGLVTVQAGQIVFDKQQVLALAGDTLKIGGYGEQKVLDAYGYEIILSDLAIALTAPTTTTTEATSAHATIAVADREGIINNVSTVSGIGINPAVADPTLTTGGGLDGAGDWIMSAVQTLENGITLTVGNTGRIATITGNIQILKAGTSDQTIRFDVEKLLSTSAP